MGKTTFLIIITQLVSNGFWFCATQFDSLFQNPTILIPMLSSVILFIMLVSFIKEEW